MNVLPENILRLMKPEDRASLGKGGVTATEAQRKWQKGEERKMHDLFATDLKRRGWPFVHSRFDRPSTIRKGWPDFTVLHGPRVVCVEFKAAGNKPDEDQCEVIAELQAAGVPVIVAYDLQTAIDFAVKHLTPSLRHPQLLDPPSICPSCQRKAWERITPDDQEPRYRCISCHWPATSPGHLALNV